MIPRRSRKMTHLSWNFGIEYRVVFPYKTRGKKDGGDVRGELQANISDSVVAR